MNTGTEDNNNDQQEDGLDLNSVFDISHVIDQKDVDDNFNILEYDGVEAPAEQNIDDDDNNDDADQGSEEEEDDGFDFEGVEDEELKLDLEVFNKKFNKNFETEQELKAYLDGKDEEEQKETQEQTYEKVESRINAIEPLIKLNDEELIKRSIEHSMMKAGKDLSEDDVQIEVEEEFQKIVDNNQLDLRANSLRKELNGILGIAQKEKQQIDAQRAAEQAQAEKESAQELQNELVKLYNTQNFYGIKPDKKTIGQIYADIKSGKFEKEVMSDKGTMAELAMFRVFKDEIFKKATGLTHSDGIKSIMDEFQNTKELNKVAGAQQRGTAGSPDPSYDLIADIVRDAPVEQ